jgi:EAL domain-containing protein (putative c-di-GMP-specific phosphodiesterase class I)
VRAFTTRACAFEALSRWVDPELGLISPADVIPTLEEAHLIHKHDVHIVRRVCADIRTRLDQGKRVLPVTVNLSRLDFGLCDIFEEVERAVTAYGIERSLIGIEVTESALTDAASAFQHEVERFRDAGYEVWIDDFGSGYSSLNVLKDFDFDVLKIDMAFLRGLEESRSSREILCTIVDMAKRIGIRTLAEGVETQAQYDFLRTIGCEMIQGFLFGAPMPVERAVTDIAVRLEGDHERAYLDSVGRVNLLSQAPHEAVDPTSGSEGVPHALVDFDGAVFRYFTGNSAYLGYLDSRGIASIGAAEAAINADETCRSALGDMARALLGTGGEGVVEFDHRGRHCRYAMRYVASGLSSHAFLVSPLQAD